MNGHFRTRVMQQKAERFTSSAADPVTTNTFQQPADAVTFCSTPVSRWASCRSHNQRIQAARRVTNGARHDRTRRT